MIPTLILLGAVLGRWWRTTLVATAVGWPIVLVASDVLVPADVPSVLVGSALGVANAALGVALHRFVLRLVRRGAHATGDRG